MTVKEYREKHPNCKYCHYGINWDEYAYCNAKEKVDAGENYKVVCGYIKKRYEDMAKENHNFFDNVQYQKALKSAIDYM